MNRFYGQIVLRSLVWPMNTAQPETGFSLMNRVKTKQRASMKSPLLRGIMIIALTDMTYEVWLNSNTRINALKKMGFKKK